MKMIPFIPIIGFILSPIFGCIDSYDYKFFISALVQAVSITLLLL